MLQDMEIHVNIQYTYVHKKVKLQYGGVYSHDGESPRNLDLQHLTNMSDRPPAAPVYIR
jgi:hypothetical protein